MVKIGQFLILCASILLGGCGNTDDSGQSAVPGGPTSVLRHIVLFKYKEGTTPNEEKTIEDAFRALKEKIEVIHSFECGKNESPENLNQDFTHCFQLTFLSNADRDVYLPHPAHKEFGSILGPHVDKVLVVDYWTKQ